MRLYLRRSVGSGGLYRHIAGHGRSGRGLETISFPTIVTKAGSRWRGIFSVYLNDKDINYALNSASCSQCVCKDRTDRQFK